MHCLLFGKTQKPAILRGLVQFRQFIGRQIRPFCRKLTKYQQIYSLFLRKLVKNLYLTQYLLC